MFKQYFTSILFAQLKIVIQYHIIYYDTYANRTIKCLI